MEAHSSLRCQVWFGDNLSSKIKMCTFTHINPARTIAGVVDKYPTTGRRVLSQLLDNTTYEIGYRACIGGLEEINNLYTTILRRKWIIGISRFL